MFTDAGLDALNAFGVVLTLALSAAALLLQAWVVATVARRVLGVPVGWPRSIGVGLLMAGALAYSVQYLYRAANVDDGTGLAVDPVVAVMFGLLAVLWVFALGVALLMVLEIAVPTGSLPSPLRMLRGWGARRRRTSRYLEVVGIAVRHGLLAQARGLNRRRAPETATGTARALRRAMEEAGVTFVKLGQMLSTRRDLLPPEYVRELSRLQTEAAPEPWPAIEEAVRRSLGRPLGEVFASVEREPLASASVAQVHRAVLLDGSRVVLKVQRPAAVAQVRQDIGIVLQLAGWLERSAPWARRLGVHSLADGFAQSLREELDYHVEEENMRAVGHALADFGVRVPAAHPDLCHRRLLVMEELAGLPVAEAAERLPRLGGAARRRLATELLRATLHQIANDGVFHADLHPGNVFVTEAGGLALLDFGSVGRLDPASQQSMNMLLFAIDKGDDQLATDALLGLLDQPERLDEKAFERSLGQLLVRYRHGLGRRGGAELFTALFGLVIHHGFSVPPQTAAAFRALGSLEGTLQLLDPTLDVVAAARAEGRRLAGERLRPGALADQLELRLLQLLPQVSALPRRLGKISEDLEQGRLAVNVRVLSDPRDRGFLNRLVQQVVVAILAGSATLAAIVLITTDTGPFLTENIRTHAFFGYTLLFMGFILALRSVVLVFQRDDPDAEEAPRRARGRVRG